MTGRDKGVIFIDDVVCADGHRIPPWEFSEAQYEDWPIPCTRRFLRSELIHPGCGARLLLTQSTNTFAVDNLTIPS